MRKLTIVLFALCSLQLAHAKLHETPQITEKMCAQSYCGGDMDHPRNTVFCAEGEPPSCNIAWGKEIPICVCRSTPLATSKQGCQALCATGLRTSMAEGGPTNTACLCKPR